MVYSYNTANGPVYIDNTPKPNRQKITPSTSSSGIGLRSLSETWPTTTVTTQRTDTPEYALNQQAYELQRKQLDLANREFESQAEIRQLQTELLKQQLSGPTAGMQQGMQALVQQYNQAFTAAKSQQEQLYQQMLGIADSTTQQRAQDIRTEAANEKADIFQRLARSGLAGSSVGNVEAAGVQTRTHERLNTLADQMQGTKLNILSQMNPAYPDLSSLQTTLAGIASQYEGSAGLQTLLTALSGIRS